MTNQERTDKSREARARRALNRQGLRLMKSRVRNPHLNNLGDYCIIEPNRNVVMAGGRYDLSLDHIEATFLSRE
jgi:hypothetical protein